MLKRYLSKYENKVDVLERFKNKETKFGLIVFESNLDISCKEIYDTYDDRWELELVFKYYQSLLDLDTLFKQ